MTKHYESHTLCADEGTGSSTSSPAKSKPEFLDEADLGFEKALEEHRQTRGSEVMSSITAKYEFSPSKFPLEHLTPAEENFPLIEAKATKTESTPTAEQATAATSAEASGAGSDSAAGLAPSAALAQQLEADLRKAEERVASWGKPLGLPSPMPAADAPATPKRDRRVASMKTRINNEKNLQKRAGSPNKAKKAAPIYIDLTYVPHNGNSYYAHVEFFKRVRARYYVFSGTEPSRDVYNALLEAKQTWENKDLG